MNRVRTAEEMEEDRYDGLDFEPDADDIDMDAIIGAIREASSDSKEAVVKGLNKLVDAVQNPALSPNVDMSPIIKSIDTLATRIEAMMNKPKTVYKFEITRHKDRSLKTVKAIPT